ncbi:MAG: polyprenol phosphomannose-dependent alpha 1,6 mannosyltransferase MptB, partial [Nocardioidaceae bacterium]
MLLRGVLGYVLVLLGGLVTSVVPASSGVGDLPVVGALRDTMPGRMVGLTVVVAGLGLACAAWLRLVRYVGRGDRADQVERLLLVRRATLVWCAPLLLAPAMFSRDGWSYAAQGKLWA